MPALILNQGGRKIGFRLRGTATIGRRDQCDVPVISQSVSRHHATITMDAQGRCFVEDAGSRNGTFVNSMRIYTPRLLDEHDVILLGTAGNCSLTFLSGDTFPEGVQEASSLKPIPFACPVCGTALIAPPTMLGQARRCGGCSVRLLIPTKEGDVPAVVDDDKPAPPPAEPASSGDDLFDEAKSVDGYAEPPSIEGVSPIDAPAGRPPLDEYDPRVLLQALDRHDHGASAPPLEHAAPESSVHDANDDDQSLHLEGDHAVQALRDPASSDNGIREDAGEAGVIDNVEPDTDSRREHAPEQRERVLDSDAAPQQMHQSADEPHGSSVGEADIQPARALDLAQFTFKPDTIYDADDVPDDAPVSSEPSPTSELDDAQPASPDADADEHQVVVANPLTPDAPHLSSDAIDEPSRLPDAIELPSIDPASIEAASIVEDAVDLEVSARALRGDVAPAVPLDDDARIAPPRNRDEGEVVVSADSGDAVNVPVPLGGEVLPDDASMWSGAAQDASARLDARALIAGEAHGVAPHDDTHHGAAEPSYGRPVAIEREGSSGSVDALVGDEAHRADLAAMGAPQAVSGGLDADVRRAYAEPLPNANQEPDEDPFIPLAEDYAKGHADAADEPARTAREQASVDVPETPAYDAAAGELAGPTAEASASGDIDNASERDADNVSNDEIDWWSVGVVREDKPGEGSAEDKLLNDPALRALRARRRNAIPKPPMKEPKAPKPDGGDTSGSSPST